jgi:adenosylmethionine-8-amino-7-oxononanoate aminotransferase
MTRTAARHPVWHPYTQHGLAGEPISIERAEGAYLYEKGGRRIFDAISSWWVNLHGHAHPRVAAAIAAQAGRLEQVIFAGFTHEPAERLAEKLLAIAPPGLDHVFFSDDGSTAVEAAVKMALGARPGRSRIAALEHAYHGDTFGAMSVSARGPFTDPYKRQLFDVVRLPLADPAGALPEDVAAVIVEPLVLGAGGMKMYPPERLRELAAACRKTGALLIADEVMTGFGRTGTMFACEQAGVSPDILCLSKGITGGFLPLGATLATGEVFDAFYSQDREKTFFHGHSYTANPIACAAAVANLEIFESEPVFERIAAIEAAHRRGLARFNVPTRQLGTIAAIEFPAGDAGYLSRSGPKLYESFLSRGVLLRPLGNVVYLLPPYCSTDEDLTLAYDAIQDAL